MSFSRRLDLEDPSGTYPPLKLLVFREEALPLLESFLGSSWEAGIQRVRGDSYSHALHGNFGPLFKTLALDPHQAARRIPDVEGRCGTPGCPIRDDGFCRPGGKKGPMSGPPLCYEPPIEADPEVVALWREVAIAWAEGRATILVEGPTFNLR